MSYQESLSAPNHSDDIHYTKYRPRPKYQITVHIFIIIMVMICTVNYDKTIAIDTAKYYLPMT